MSRPPGRYAPVWPAVLALLLAAGFVAGFAAYVLGFSALQQASTQARLMRDVDDRLAEGRVPAGGDIVEGTPVAVLDIPALGLRQVVVEGSSGGMLTRGPGHLRNSALPGQYGRSVVLGRRYSYGGVFARLDELQVGDALEVTTAQSGGLRARYVVERRALVRPGELDEAVPAGPPHRLVLETADSPAAQGSLVVVAALRGDPAAAPSGRIRAVRPDETGLAADPRAQLPLLLWTQALVVVGAVTTWLYHRWDPGSAWLLTTPLLMTVLWNVYDNLAQLLPSTW